MSQLFNKSHLGSLTPYSMLMYPFGLLSQMESTLAFHRKFKDETGYILQFLNNPYRLKAKKLFIQTVEALAAKELRSQEERLAESTNLVYMSYKIGRNIFKDSRLMECMRTQLEPVRRFMELYRT